MLGWEEDGVIEVGHEFLTRALITSRLLYLSTTRDQI